MLDVRVIDPVFLGPTAGSPSRQVCLDTKERQGLIDAFSCRGTIDPGKVFDLTLPLDQTAEGYRAMDQRRAIKTLLKP